MKKRTYSLSVIERMKDRPCSVGASEGRNEGSRREERGVMDTRKKRERRKEGGMEVRKRGREEWGE